MNNKKAGRTPGSIDDSNRYRKDHSVSINHQRHEHTDEVMALFRIISRHDWDRLQGWHRSCPGSNIEHLHAGLYVLTIPAGGAGEIAA